MTTELHDAIQAVYARCLSLVAVDAELNEAVRRLARALLALTEGGGAAAAVEIESPRTTAAAARPDRETSEAMREKEPSVPAGPAAAPLPAPVSAAVPPAYVPPPAYAPPPPAYSAGPAYGYRERERERPEPAPRGVYESRYESPRGAYESGRMAEAARRENSRWAPVTDSDLPIIAERCRLKAEGSRWAATRKRRLQAGADFKIDIEPHDKEIIDRARALPDCFLWMNHPSGPAPTNLGLYEELAGCYDATAKAISVLIDSLELSETFPELFEKVLQQTAEAQSSLRTAVARIDGPHFDNDQIRIFTWLKNAASQRQIFIARHMRANDPAESSIWPEIMERLHDLEDQVAEARKKNKGREKLFNKARHRLKLACAEGASDALDHWEMFAQAIQELIDDGVAPTHREIRLMLEPVFDSIPELDNPPPGFTAVITELDRLFRKADEDLDEDEFIDEEDEHPDVLEVRRLLQGKSAVMFAPELDNEAKEDIEAAFDLRELVWIVPAEGESIDAHEATVARSDVVLVINGIKWTSPHYARIRQFCEKHARPYVKSTPNHEVESLAATILAECSQRLSRQTSPTS